MWRFITLGLFSVPSWVGAQCSMDAHSLQANYRMHTERADKVVASSQLQLSRRDQNTVALSYMPSQITELWQHLANGMIRPIRYFDAYQRGVEYQPSEVSQQIDWQMKYQLLSAAQLKAMTLVGSQGEGCYREESFQQQDAYESIQVTWLPELRLVKQLTISQRGQTEHWVLDKVTQEPKAINAVFQRLDSYASIDYADIGDSESDPFVAKMINMGFVQHGASGFYNAQGEAIEGGHHH